MKHFSKEKEQKLSQFFEAIFDNGNVEKGISEFALWFEKIGAPSSFKQAGISEPDIKRLVELALRCGEHRGSNLNQEQITNIYMLAK
jgi:alcohol dehydrogenase YqhD (iron-dependent ADH family)